MVNEKTVLKQLKNILEQAHENYTELHHASAFEQELHLNNLEEIYDYISDYFENSYSIEYVKKLEKEHDALMIKYEDLEEDYKDLKKTLDRVKEVKWS